MTQISELLGSFGDNELSPECLDGAQRFLKPDGINIPVSYTALLAPVQTTRLWQVAVSAFQTRFLFAILWRDATHDLGRLSSIVEN